MAGKITDIYVNITTTHPVAAIGLGVPGIFVAGDTLNDQHYTSLEALTADYDNGTDVYKAAKTYFDQPDAGKSIEVITYTASKTDDTTKVTTGGISEAATAYYWGAWHFAGNLQRCRRIGTVQLHRNSEREILRCSAS